MKMKKLLFTCAAVAGVSLALGATAFADVAIDDVTETTNTTTASVAALPESTGQMTVIVVKLAAPADGATSIATPTSISDNDIIYIDQDAYASDMFQSMGLKDTLSVGDYYMVRVGGENIAESGIVEEVYKVVSAIEEIDYGNVDKTGDSATKIDNKDAMAVLEASAGLITLTSEQEKAANVDQTGDSAAKIDNKDAMAVLEASAGLVNATLFPYK